MKAGKTGRFLTVIMCAVMLNGCGILGEQAWEPEETSLQVKKDGTLTETVIDRLDETYYSSSELESMIDSSVEEYNQEHGVDAVTVDSFAIEESQVVLTMSYKSATDYADYNNVKFYNGSMLGAEMEGYLFYNQFKEVEDGTVVREDLSNEEPLKHKEYQVLVTDDSHLVQVPGNVVYVSANGSPVGEREVKPLGDTTTTTSSEDGLVLPSSAVYVEEEDSQPVTAKDMEKTYLYIIYEF